VKLYKPKVCEITLVFKPDQETQEQKAINQKIAERWAEKIDREILETFKEREKNENETKKNRQNKQTFNRKV